MTHCYGYIDKEYTSVWDTFDMNDQQQFLDYMEERHKKHLSIESDSDMASLLGDDLFGIISTFQ